MTNAPLCHLFKSYDNFYLYDTNKNQILKLTHNVYSTLKECFMQDDFYSSAESACDVEFKKFYVRAIEKGYFNSKRLLELKHPASDSLEQLLKTGINAMALQVTQSCNFRCGYCPYSGFLYVNRKHSAKQMSWDTAKEAIDFLITHSSASNSVNLAFYGGEPLIRFDIIKKSIEYLENNISNKKITYNVTTNATLLTEQIMEFFVDHDMNILISLDGPKDIHDKERRFVEGNGTYDVVIQNFKKYEALYPEYFGKHVSFNAVVNYDKSITIIDDFFQNESSIVNRLSVQASFVSEDELKEGIELEKNEAFIISNEFEGFKVILHCLGLYLPNAELTQISILATQHLQLKNKYKQLSNELLELPDSFHPGGPCIPGLKKVFVNSDGVLYPCERLNEEADEAIIGTLKTGFNVAKANYILNIGRITEESCKNCWALYYCTMCIGHCIQGGKTSAEKRLKACSAIKKSVEDDMVAISIYKELGYDFDLEKCYRFERG